MNLLNHVMVRQKERDAGNKFSMSEVTHTQDFYMSAVLSWVISSTSKSEDKEQACSRMGDHTDAVGNAASLFMLILNHCLSRITERTALLTQNVFWATYERELGRITHLQIHVLIIWSLEWLMSPQHPWKISFLPLHVSSLCINSCCVQTQTLFNLKHSGL